MSKTECRTARPHTIKFRENTKVTLKDAILGTESTKTFPKDKVCSARILSYRQKEEGNQCKEVCEVEIDGQIVTDLEYAKFVFTDEPLMDEAYA